MPTEGSVTYWIERVKAGDEVAVQKLWERYFQRLVRLARERLGTLPRRVADEEDVALNAFDSFYRGMQLGKYPDVRDRNNLWRLLIAITLHKVVDTVRWETRKKRGGGKVLDERALQNERDSAEEPALLEAIAKEPTPEIAAILAESFRLRLQQLRDETLRQVALKKLEGYGNEEIAAELGCAARTVERKLQLIRRVWTD